MDTPEGHGDADDRVVLVAAILFAWGMVLSAGFAAVVLASMAWTDLAAAAVTAGVGLVAIVASLTCARVILRVVRG